MPNPMGSFFDVFTDPTANPTAKLRLGAGLRGGYGAMAGPPGLGGMGPPGLGGMGAPGLGARPPLMPISLQGQPPMGGPGIGIGQPGAPAIKGATLDPMAEARKRMALKPVTI